MSLREQLLKDLDQINGQYADNLLSKFSTIPELEKSLQNKEFHLSELVKQKVDELQKQRETIEQNKREFDKRMTDMITAQEVYVNKEKEYVRLIEEFNVQVKELDKKTKDAEVSLAVAKDVENQVRNKLQEADVLKQKYGVLIDSLKVDTDKLIKDRTDLNKEKEKLDIEKKDFEKQREEFYFESVELRKRESAVDRREKVLKVQGETNASTKK